MCLLRGPFVSIPLLLFVFVFGLKQEFAAPPVAVADTRCQIIFCSSPHRADFASVFLQDLVRGWQGFLPQPWNRVGLLYSSPTSSACPWENVCWPSTAACGFAYSREWPRGTGGLVCLSLGAAPVLYICLPVVGGSLYALLLPQIFLLSTQWKIMKKAYEWVQISLVSGTPAISTFQTEVLTHNYQEHKIF